MYSFMCIPQLYLSIFSSQNYLPETLKITFLIIKEKKYNLFCVWMYTSTGKTRRVMIYLHLYHYLLLADNSVFYSFQEYKMVFHGDFPCSPMVRTLLSNAGCGGSSHGQGTKIPHALGPKKQNIKKEKQNCNKFNKGLKHGPHQNLKKSQSMCLNDPFIGLTVCQALC